MANRPTRSDYLRNVTPAITRSASRSGSVPHPNSNPNRDACRRNRSRRSQQLRLLRMVNPLNSNTTSSNSSEQATARRAARARILAERRHARNHNDSESAAVHNHFTRMRSPRHPSPFHQDPVFKGIRVFNSPIDETVVPTFEYNDLDHDRNYVCPHCDSHLWKEERTKRFSCCNNGKYAIHKLREVPLHIWNIYNTTEFQRNQRKYNSLFSFTALSAGGLRKQTWTQPYGPSMLTMHGRAYHRIFDLQQHYANMTVTNTSRFYIYDSEFNSQSRQLQVNSNTAALLRSYFHQSIPWATQYRSAVDEVLRNATMSPEAAVIEFAEVSRVNDGHVLGTPSAPEIAAILYPSKSGCSCTQPVITYPKNSPDDKPRFLDLYSPAYEPLQFPCLFNHGESGWSRGHYTESPPRKSKTMNRAGKEHVPFLFYCRQRLLSEPLFQRNSRIAQEWCCDMYSRFEENKLSYFESDELQHKVRLATRRSITECTPDHQPGKLLPASFHGSPLKRKSDTEDALSIVNRRGRPQVFITITCNPLWPEIVDNLLPNQTASDRPDLCCRVFKYKIGQIIADLKSGKVFSDVDFFFYTIEFQQRGFPHCHLVCRFNNDDAFTNMDSWVWAQLPSPDIANGRLREAVLNFMVHRPCGTHNVSATCMDTNKPRSGTATSTSHSHFVQQLSSMTKQVVPSTNVSTTATGPPSANE